MEQIQGLARVMFERPLPQLAKPCGARQTEEMLAWSDLRALALMGMAALVCAACGNAQSAPLPDTAPPSSPIARCMNLSNALEAPREGEWGYTITQADLARMAAAGIDTVRLPVKVSGHADVSPPFTIDPALLARLDEIVEQATLLGLQIIIDLHHYDEINRDPEAHWPRLKALWAQLSLHFQNAPETVMFELLNEPHDAITIPIIERFNADLLALVRETNPHRWVILGSTQWGAWDVWEDTRFPNDDPRVITTFHYYDPYEFTHQGIAWSDDPPPTGRGWGTAREQRALDAAFDRIRNVAAAKGQPVLMGEFGVYAEVPIAFRAAWTTAVRDAADRRGIGWCHWGFAADFRAFDPETETWIPDMADALGLTPLPALRR